MAYATLLSLTETIEFILNPPHHHLSPVLYESRRPFLQSLHENLSFLLSFMDEDFAHTKSRKMTRLERRIRAIAYEAIHIIESQVSNGLRFKSKELKKITERVSSISAEVVKIKDLNVIKNHPPTKFSLVGSSKSDHANKNPTVGFHYELKAIRERLFTPPSELAIISIVGMGGISKTTLARTIFNDSKVVSRFDARCWLTVSQTYDVRDMLARLLKSIQGNESNQGEVQELGESLYKSLIKKRYLVVIDDLWDIKAWNDMKRFFPRDNIGSRIILTTRLLDVAVDANSSSPIYRPSLLNLDDSWKLLCQQVFGDGSCPLELEEIGKQIAKNCKGLPLALVVIGGLLSRGDKKVDYWTYIQQNINSALVDDDDDFMEILALSYYHLPHRLRACFLYMGVFLEDHMVSKSKLIKLWVAEGFVKPHASKSSEEVAYDYLHDLVDRNMILVGERNSLGEIRTCGIHDLVRDLCERITQEEKFLRVIPAQVRKKQIRIVKYEYSASIPSGNRDYYKGVYGSQARSLLQFSRGVYDPQFIFIVSFQKPRVLDVEVTLAYLPFDIANLRFLSLRSWGKFNLNVSISKLLHLQTLIVHDTETTLPEEIWNMPRLRHILVYNSCLFPYPSGAQNGENYILSRNLQTLKTVLLNSTSMKDVLGLMPNLKNLNIHFEEAISGVELSSYISKCFAHLHQLERLRCRIAHIPYPLLEDFRLPLSLRKFTLRGCNLSRKSMAIIGSLPDLQFLKLWDCDFVKGVWEPTEGEFAQLKSLVLDLTNLKHFNADEMSFPSLECLDISWCDQLKKIPSRIGDIPTLRLIKVVSSSKSVAKSVALIRKEQEDIGNENLNIMIDRELRRDKTIEKRRKTTLNKTRMIWKARMRIGRTLYGDEDDEENVNYKDD